MCLPSGDQAGSAPLVIRRAFVPSAFATYTSVASPRVRSNATRRPSGDSVAPDSNDSGVPSTRLPGASRTRPSLSTIANPELADVADDPGAVPRPGERPSERASGEYPPEPAPVGFDRVEGVAPRERDPRPVGRPGRVVRLRRVRRCLLVPSAFSTKSLFGSVNQPQLANVSRVPSGDQEDPVCSDARAAPSAAAAACRRLEWSRSRRGHARRFPGGEEGDRAAVGRPGRCGAAREPPRAAPVRPSPRPRSAGAHTSRRDIPRRAAGRR